MTLGEAISAGRDAWWEANVSRDRYVEYLAQAVRKYVEDEIIGYYVSEECDRCPHKCPHSLPCYQMVINEEKVRMRAKLKGGE